MKRARISSLSLSARVSLLRKGVLSAFERAEAVADFGSQNFWEAKPDVERLLDDPDPLVRFNAMATLAYEWGTTGRVDRITEILRCDSDRDCRRQAAGALGSLHRGARDKAVLRMLARTVSEEREEDDVRLFAYKALLDVLGIDRQSQPNPVSMALREIDWEVVKKYET